MKVKLLTSLNGRSAGEEITMTTAGGQHLIARGYAEPVQAAPKRTKQKAASSDTSTVSDTVPTKTVPSAEAGAPAGDSPSKAAKTAG